MSDRSNRCLTHDPCWQVLGLRHQCLHLLIANIKEETLLDYFEVADMVQDQELKESCLKYWQQAECRYGRNVGLLGLVLAVI